MSHSPCTSDSRRQFLARSLGLATLPLAAGLFGCQTSSAERQDSRASDDPDHWFEISLAQWSLHQELFAGTLDHLDFARVAREEFNIGAVEYVNSFFKTQAQDSAYLGEMRSRADDLGVRSLLIMCDGEGNLGDASAAARTKAIENHYKWVDAAAFLGCLSIRVNAASSGTWAEQRDRAADGLRRLTEFAAESDINVIVENHGGLSSNGRWLSETIAAVDHERCGTLPDFGNFNIGEGRRFDRYVGVELLMPFAKAVSAKSHDFDSDGNEIHTDYLRMMRIVRNAGYRGWVGIEYEGTILPPREGIRATQRLLERVRGELASS